MTMQINLTPNYKAGMNVILVIFYSILNNLLLFLLAFSGNLCFSRHPRYPWCSRKSRKRWSAWITWFCWGERRSWEAWEKRKCRTCGVNLEINNVCGKGMMPKTQD
jgi:hypothetical protein